MVHEQQCGGGFKDKTEKNSVRDMAVAYMHKCMLEEGSYFSSSVYDECAVQCLGKGNIVDAKQDLTKFTHTHNMAKDAARNFRSEVAKRVRAEVLKHYVGDDKVWDYDMENFDQEMAEDLLAGDQYRVATTGAADFFGNNLFRQILYNAFPLSRSELASRNIWALPEELTAHQIAFVDVKVRSMLYGQHQIPHHGSEHETMILQYQGMVQHLQEEGPVWGIWDGIQPQLPSTRYYLPYQADCKGQTVEQLETLTA
ncbi:hypothetical protein WJX77_004465 [Trebouxia sp. C0004]